MGSSPAPCMERSYDTMCKVVVTHIQQTLFHDERKFCLLLLRSRMWKFILCMRVRARVHHTSDHSFCGVQKKSRWMMVCVQWILLRKHTFAVYTPRLCYGAKSRTSYACYHKREYQKVFLGHECLRERTSVHFGNYLLLLT